MAKKQYKDIKKFIVKRAKWLRGEMGSSLLNDEGKKCCLGFYAESCGLRSQDILEMGSPIKVISFNKKEWDTFLVDNYSYKNSYICEKMMSVNDSESLTDVEREVQLTKLFAEQGIKIKFIN